MADISWGKSAFVQGLVSRACNWNKNSCRNGICTVRQVYCLSVLEIALFEVDKLGEWDCRILKTFNECSLKLAGMILSKIIILYIITTFAKAIELTFELPDNANQCFFEEIRAGIDCVIEYQVVTGGQYDVDMTLQDKGGKILYKGVKKQYDSFSWKTESEGTYKVCFSNEFSTFSHKVVYMDWQKGDEGQLLANVDKVTSRIAAMTQLEASASAIGDRLRLIDDYQTHHRLREATGRKRAEDLNERVLLWSLGQTAIIIALGIAQVLLLRSFFIEKRTIF